MTSNLNKKFIMLTIAFGFMSLTSHNAMAASGEAALNQDWHVALPAELPVAAQEFASLDQ